ncbi:DUF3298 and DUF4163 domain-containing protein [Clostridium aminobutyricum]|uniref:DUF3298 and DUF4163 domain-containing protein n=1 Tax=Clostridium aminobutyricum TaxID=33953 RepID=A0A939D771_CLOAM|nr:DUF3298 and DUF4163 domain-containing protein [Clostridium aminobutyricum]MBN7772351.1 DUF3298 and DUF4163 domain-containing protein [Clostridium aminobutyricum]
MADNVKVIKHTIEEDMYYNNELVLSYNIQYPQFRSYEFFDSVKQMNKYYYMKAVSYQHYCIQTLYKLAVQDYQYSIANDFPVHQYEAMQVFDITYNQNCTVSLYSDRYEYTGGAHGNTVRTSETWDLQSGSHMTLKQLVNAPEGYRKYILNLINNQINEQISKEQYYYFENYQENTAEYFDENNFYLTTEGIVIYYPLYSIAPYSSGIVEFTILYAAGLVEQPECNRMRMK